MLYEDYPIVDLDSDPEVGQDSSDDDIDVLLSGTPEQRRKLRRRSLGHKSDSSEDEFEKEMREELDETMKYIRQTQSTDVDMPSPSDAAGKKENNKGEKVKDAAEQFYDDAYFESDSDDDESSPVKAKKKHPIPSNDDLLYDPNIDDDNQKWIDGQRRKYQPRVTPSDSSQKPTGAQNPKRLPHSDAVLNCPACMTVLCLDCQRHVTYKNQYRAMFVMNCRVDETEVLKYPQQMEPKKGKGKRKEQKKLAEVSSEGASSSGDAATEPPKDSDTDVYHPVRCSCCTTEVGVCDEDELYHFFNVLASYS